MPEISPANIHGIENFFAGLVFKILLAEGMIFEELVEKMRSWKHSGFSLPEYLPITFNRSRTHALRTRLKVESVPDIKMVHVCLERPVPLSNP